MTRLELFMQSERETRSRRHHSRHTNKKRSRRLAVEALEDRRLLAGVELLTAAQPAWFLESGVGRSPSHPLAIGVLGGEGEGLVLAGNIDPVTISGRKFHDVNANGLDDLAKGIVPVASVVAHNAHQVQVVGDLAYVAVYESGLWILDVSVPASPVAVGSFNTPGFASGIYLAGDIAYVADNRGVRIVDVSDPAEPTDLGSFNDYGFQDLQVVGNLAYAAASNRFRVLDVSRPIAPLGSLVTPGSANDVRVVGGLAYVADDFAGLQILDVTNPGAPVLLGSYDTPGSAYSLDVVETLVFVADYDGGLRIVDVSDPTAPVLLATFDTEYYAYGVDVAGGLAFVADGESGLLILDVSTPSEPVQLARAQTDYACNVQVVGNLAYVADSHAGLQMLDVSNPAAPAIVGAVGMPGQNTYGVQIVGNLAYVAASDGGLQIVNVREPGVGGVLIELFRDGGDGIFGSDGAGADAGTGQNGDDDILVDSALTSVKSGSYAFVVDTSGNYFVRENVPTGYLQTFPADVFHTIEVTADEGGIEFVGLDFGNTDLFDLVTIGGRTFEDLNADGTDNGGIDPGLGNVTVELWQDGGDSTADFGDDGDDILFASAVAGIGGGFSIPEVPAGTFYLRPVVPDGGVQTTSPVFYTITTASGVDAADQDFGVAFYGSIHGFKFEDIDGDGIYSPGIDQPMAGVLFTLTGTDGQGAVISLTDTTDSDGYFDFTGLLPSVAGAGPGTGYTVTETVPAGWMLTTPTAVNSDLLGGQALVAFEGQAMIPPPSYEEFQKLVSSDRGVPNQYPEYGYSVAIDGNVAVVGARCAAGCRGAAYVLEFDGAAWSEVAKLTASDGADDDEFGLAVGISGDTIVVGAHGHDVGVGSRVGAAYVYLRPDTGWATTSQFDAKLSASDGASGNGFGWSVGVSGDSIVVGAYGHKVENYQSAGAAYVFQRPDTGWTTTDVYDARLIASDPGDNHYFGWAVSISGDKAVIGTDGAAAAYVYQSQAGFWSEVAKLTASDAIEDRSFGNAVAINEDTLVIGAPHHSINYVSLGAAYVYRKPDTGWADTDVFEAKLMALNSKNGDRFGFSVDISGDTIVVGAHYDTENGDYSGAAYVFRRPVGGWISTTEDAKLLASDGSSDDYFGWAVSISSNRLFIGAPWEGYYKGAVYVFVRVPGDPRTEVVVGDDLMFGNTVLGSIRGFKFEDLNEDGIYTPDLDQPMAGVQFTLTGTDGQGNEITRTVATDEQGYFEFTDLWPSVLGAGPGTGYTVTEIVPDSYVATTATSFSSDLWSGDELVAPMFGNTRPVAIHGFKFHDIDGDGAYSEGIDLPLADVAFTLTGTDVAGNVICVMQTTDSNGYFQFTDLAPSVDGVGLGRAIR